MKYLRQLTITALVCFNFSAMAQLTKGTPNGLSFESEKGIFNKLTDDKYRPRGLDTYSKYAHKGIMFLPSVTPIGSQPAEEKSAAEWYMLFSSPYLKFRSNRPITEFSSIEEYDDFYQSSLINLARWMLWAKFRDHRSPY